MKSAVFARPSLKVFLLGAILIAVVQNFMANGLPLATVLHARALSQTAAGPESELQGLLAQAESGPTSQLYARISRCYEKRGAIRKALLYIRKADVLAEFEETSD